MIETEITAPCLKFGASLSKNHLSPLTRTRIETVQINLGKLCNQTCNHCHVEAGPGKIRENMAKETVDRILDLIAKTPGIRTVDLTGGAPELNPNFRNLVRRVRQLGISVIDRCNLTVLFEKGQEDTAQFLRDHEVEVTASLPCYSSANVDAQRGDGVFAKSIRGLQMLNRLGYGVEGGLSLNLVYNPVGPSLPPAQQNLEKTYKERLKADFNIEFSRLFCITNMPIKRFRRDLERQGKLDSYLELLVEKFNPAAVEAIMCRTMVSIGWDGKLFDCDFNQMLEMQLQGNLADIWSVESFESLVRKNIAVADHCYGCTAGAGSSCGGTIV